MSVFFPKGSDRFKKTELVDIPDSSVNVQVQNDNAFDGVPVKPSFGLQSDVVLKGAYPFNPFFDGKYVNNTVGFLYGQMYGVDQTDSIVDYGQGITFSLGVVSKDTNVFAGLWNSFTEDTVTITGINASPSTGILIEYPAVSDAILPRSETDMKIIVSSDAPPVTNSDITVTFDNGESVVFNVRAIIGATALFIPESNVVEFLSFGTNVITARNGEEQRRALRRYPRHNLSTEWKEIDSARANTTKNQLSSNVGHVIGNGFWHMNNRPGIAPQIGDLVISIDTQYAMYEVDEYCIIYEDMTDQYEIKRIESFDSVSITCTEEIENDYTNAIVAPYFFMYNSTPISWSESTNHTQFDLEGVMTTPVTVEEWTFADEYKSSGVLPYNCNLFKSDSIDAKVTNLYDEFDGYTGTMSKLAVWDSSKKTITVGIHAKTKAECWQLRQIIYALRGRQKSIWVPTFNKDFRPNIDISGTDIVCELNSFATYLYDTDSIFKHIGVYEDGSNPVYTEIIEAEEDGVDQFLTVADSLGTIDKDSVKLSTLMLCRLNSDVSEIEWISPSECYCELGFIAVKE